MKTKIPLADATRISWDICQDLLPSCASCQVVGSLRRESPMVGDIDIMLIPNLVPDLFGTATISAIETVFPALVEKWGAHWYENGPKKKSLILPSGVKLELYISTPEAWAFETVIRTGPEAFTKNCVTTRRAGGYLPSDCIVKDGWKVYRHGHVIPLATERDVLEFLGLGWLEPSQRV